MNELITAPAIAELPRAPIINAEGERIKQELLLCSREIRGIQSALLRDGAIDTAGRIKGHLKAVEDSYKEVSGPFYKMWQTLGEVKKKHISELESEMNRLNREVGAYNEEQRLKLRREQEERDREAQRIANEQIAAAREADRVADQLRKEQEALALKQKQAQEAAERKGKELTPEAKAKALQAQLEAQEREEAAEAARIKKQEMFHVEQRRLEQERLEAAERARQEKATGGAQRTDYEIEVTDIHALYAYSRAFVTMKPDLVNIKFAIRTHPDHPIPGIVFRAVSSFSAKAR